MQLLSKLISTANPRYLSFSLPAPISGKVVELDTFPSLIYGQRFMGEGVVIQASGFQVFSPIAGTVTLLEGTAERIRIRAKNGLLLQIQIGHNTHTLMGAGFKPKVKLGQEVTAGQNIMDFDLAGLKRLQDKVLCPITLVNSEKLHGVLPHYGQAMAMQEHAMTLFFNKKAKS